MGLENELENFLETNFGVNDLIRPLFYNFPVGIRFDIGVGSPKTKEYDRTCNLRANTIFHELFNEGDNILIVIDTYEDGESDYNGVWIKHLSPLVRAYTDNTCQEIVHEWNDEFTFKRYIYKTKRQSIDIGEMIKSIVDGIDSDIYIINLDREIIYFLYDDRGLDIIAKEPESIKHIYSKYNEWILDYDREKIDDLFMHIDDDKE